MKLRRTCTVFCICFLSLLVSISGGSYVNRQQEDTGNRSNSSYTIRAKNKTAHWYINIQSFLSKLFASNKNEIVSRFKIERPIGLDVSRRQLNASSTLISNTSTVVLDNADFHNETQRFKDKMESSVSRKRRYNYEDTYEWNEDDKVLEYDVDENSMVQKIGRSWKKVAASICFVAAGLILACICGRIAWVVCLPYIKDACYMTYCPILHSVYQEYEICCKDDADQLERDFRTIANMLGIKLTLEDFQAIREHYGFDGGKHVQDFDSIKSAAKKYDVDVGVPLM